MAFEFTIGDTPSHPPARVTGSLYDLVSIVLHREFDFPLLTRLFSLGTGRADAADLLREGEILKDAAKAHTRPYIDVGRPLELIELEGMLKFPKLLKHEAQIVTDWTEIVVTGEQQSGIVSSPPTLLSGQGRLHLVDAVATEVAAAGDWMSLPYISANEFRWELGGLLADGVQQMDAPAEYLRPWLKHEILRPGQATLYEAWQDEIDSLIDACHEAVRVNEPIVVRS